jgi:hydroxypyruvate isomerase
LIPYFSFFATILRMLTRRSFGKLTAAAMVAPAINPAKAMGQGARESGLVESQFSIMMWTLNRYGVFEENLERVAQAGYQNVAVVSDFREWSEEDVGRIRAHMQRLDISMDTLGGMKAGFADPSGGDAFVEELKVLIAGAKRMGSKQLILLSGKRMDGASSGSQHAASIETLKRSGELLRTAGLVGVIEPIDRLENPTIYLDGVTEAFEIVRAVGSSNVKVLYDLYHEQRQYGNLIDKLDKNIHEIGMIHIADVPGRHEPGTGEINYANVYRKLGQLRFKGMIAMEFYPTGDVVETLRRAREEAIHA